MFKHILLPTDGSELAEEIVRKGVEFARMIGAAVTGFHVAEEHATLFSLQDVRYSDSNMAVHMENSVLETAIQAMSFVESAANDAGVDCTCYCTRDQSIPEAIVRVAKARNCDLIWMTSSGKKGFPGFLAENNAEEVLNGCDIPVMLFRHPED